MIDRSMRIFDDDWLDRQADLDQSPDEDMLTSRAIANASARIAMIYGDLLGSGMTEDAVARAVIGAALTLYDAIGYGEALPAILRRIAARIERDRTAH
ncbi:MAG: hypothetical protein ACTHKR_08620 [Sphingomonas sp.]